MSGSSVNDELEAVERSKLSCAAATVDDVSAPASSSPNPMHDAAHSLLRPNSRLCSPRHRCLCLPHLSTPTGADGAHNKR